MDGKGNSLWKKIFGNRKVKVNMVGLQGSGQTTLLFLLAKGQTVPTTPTCGFNLETVEYDNIDFEFWDLNSQERLRPTQSFYFNKVPVHYIMFVIDAADKDQFDKAKSLLELCLSWDERNIPLLVVANKQDRPGASNAEEIAEMLGLEALERKWFVIPTCCLIPVAKSGIERGLNWLSSIEWGRKDPYPPIIPGSRLQKIMTIVKRDLGFLSVLHPHIEKALST